MTEKEQQLWAEAVDYACAQECWSPTTPESEEAEFFFADWYSLLRTESLRMRDQGE